MFHVQPFCGCTAIDELNGMIVSRSRKYSFCGFFLRAPARELGPYVLARDIPNRSKFSIKLEALLFFCPPQLVRFLSDVVTMCIPS
jgi:hypothetical protein